MIALLVLAAVVASASRAEQPPSPVPASAPATEFSAERAGEHLRRITSDQPTPIGSAGSDEVRDYLVAELAALGLAVEVQEGLGAYTFTGDTVAGRVENVVATLPGQDSTGRVVLAAHYDTTFGSPGAADDKASVAAILETTRALTSGPPLRNDLVVLLTDGEEPGMLGAASFAAQHPYGTEGGVVLNWEATGSVGPSALFETARGNADLIEEFAASAPYPVGDSAMAEMYRAGSQNTDFTVLQDEGFSGLNFGLVDGNIYYHSRRDTVANLDPGSLQHHGANMLGLTRGFGDRDLADLRSDRDMAFFTAFGLVISYPAWLIWPLAGLALAAVAVLAVLTRLRGLATVPRLLAGVAAGLVPVVAAPAAAIGLWEVLVGIRPGYGALFMGDPYRPQLYRWALGALAATILLAWYLAMRRWIGAVPMAVGALVWPAVLGAVAAALIPGMSHWGALSAVAAAAGALIALLIGEKRPGWRVAALTCGIAPGAFLLILGGRGLLGVLGIAGGAGAVFFFVLAGLVALPLVELVLAGDSPGRSSAVLPVAAAALTLALTGAGLAVDRFDEDHPAMAHLLYVLDADAGTARWASEDATPHRWTAQYVPERRDDDAPPTLPLPYGTDPEWIGAADALPLDAPQLEVMDSAADGEATVLELQVASSREADVITLHADLPVTDVTITADGQPPVTSTPTYPDDVDSRQWPYELRFYDPPLEGFRVTLRSLGPEPPRIALSDYTVGMEQVPGFTPRPSDLERSPDHSSDLVVVGRTYQP